MFKIIIFTILLTAFSVVEVKASDCVLKVGVVPQFEQRKILNTWSPIFEKLGKKTSCEFKLSGSKTILEFEKNFKNGDYDIAYMNPYHAVMANDAQGYIPIARSGSKMLQGILTVHKDSGINDIKQLNRKKIAFPSPNALGASLLMRAELKTKHGIDVEPLYVKTHSSVYLHVAKKLTMAGGGVMRTLKEQKPSIQNRLDIVYTTTPVPAHPLVVHPRIIAMKDIIQNSWLEMAQEDSNIFDHIPMKKPITTSMEDYNSLRKLGLDKFVGTKE